MIQVTTATLRGSTKVVSFRWKTGGRHAGVGLGGGGGGLNVK